MIKAYLCFQEAHGLARSMEQETDWRKEIKVPCGEGSVANNTSCCTLGLLHSLAGAESSYKRNVRIAIVVRIIIIHKAQHLELLSDFSMISINENERVKCC